MCSSFYGRSTIFAPSILGGGPGQIQNSRFFSPLFFVFTSPRTLYTCFPCRRSSTPLLSTRSPCSRSLACRWMSPASIQYRCRPRDRFVFSPLFHTLLLPLFFFSLRATPCILVSRTRPLLTSQSRYHTSKWVVDFI